MQQTTGKQRDALGSHFNYLCSQGSESSRETLMCLQLDNSPQSPVTNLEIILQMTQRTDRCSTQVNPQYEKKER